ncbi:hypothetical protein Tco_0002722 [Tanacetum coccineum]
MGNAFAERRGELEGTETRTPQNPAAKPHCRGVEEVRGHTDWVGSGGVLRKKNSTMRCGDVANKCVEGAEYERSEGERSGEGRKKFLDLVMLYGYGGDRSEVYVRTLVEQVGEIGLWWGNGGLRGDGKVAVRVEWKSRLTVLVGE